MFAAELGNRFVTKNDSLYLKKCSCIVSLVKSQSIKSAEQNVRPSFHTAIPERGVLGGNQAELFLMQLWINCRTMDLVVYARSYLKMQQFKNKKAEGRMVFAHTCMCLTTRRRRVPELPRALFSPDGPVESAAGCLFLHLLLHFQSLR